MVSLKEQHHKFSQPILLTAISLHTAMERPSVTPDGDDLVPLRANIPGLLDHQHCQKQASAQLCSGDRPVQTATYCNICGNISISIEILTTYPSFFVAL